MDFEALYGLCQSRKSIRAYSGKPVAPEIIEKIKAAAATAPYATGKGHWEILVLKDKETMQVLENLVKERTETLRQSIREDLKPSFESYAASFRGFSSAPVLFIPTFRVTPALSLMAGESPLDLARWERDNYVKSISCVCMVILLAARSLGLGSCYMTGPLIAADTIGKAAGIRPGHEVGALIPLGYPEAEETIG